MADTPTKKQMAEMRKQRDEARMDKGTEAGYKATTKRDDSGAVTKPEEKAEKKKRGGTVGKKYAKGGSVSRGDGCCKRGKTKGRMV